MKLRASTAKKLRTFLEEVTEKPIPLPGEAVLRAAAAAEFAVELAQHRLPKKVLPFPTRKERSAAKAAAHRESTDEIRAAVEVRAAGICECGCGGAFTKADPFTMDHWLGGLGRRRQKQSVETCWGLRWSCHLQARQLNLPSAAAWNEKRRVFCARWHYRFQPHVEHQPARRRA